MFGIDLNLSAGRVITASGIPSPSGGGGVFANTYSIDLDGTDDYMSVADADDLSFGNGSTDSPFTLALWLNSDTAGTVRLIAKGFGVPQEYSFSVGSAGTPGLTLYDENVNSRIQIVSQTALTQGVWQHWAVTYDGSGSHSNSKIYLNGVAVSTTTSSSGTYVAMHNTSTPVNVGRHNITVSGTTYDTFANGKMDEVAIFNSALSASDISAIYNSGVPTDLASYSPVGWWRMGDNDSGTGTTITDQGSGSNNGTLVNGATFSTNVPFNYYSLDFDGTDDYVSTELSVVGESELTVSSWVKLDNSSATRGLVTQYVGGGDRAFRLALFPNISVIQGFYFEVYGAGSYASYKYASVGDIPTGSWVHVAGVFSQSSCVCYVNGVASTTTSGIHSVGTGNIASCSDNIDIGRMANADYMDGKIDEVAVWTSALSASDITAIYNSGVPTDISSYSPVAWWRMGDNDGATGTTITDQGSGGNNGTLNNGPTFSTDVPVAFTNTRSLSFDGTNDYGDAGVVSALQNTSALSVSVWFKKGATSEWPAWGGFSSGSDNISGHGYLNDLWFNVRNGVETRYVVPSSNLPSDTTDFHHYVYTFDGGTFKVYVDGTERSGTKFNSGTTSTGTANFNFKLGYQGFHYDQGLYDEFAIFSSALSSSDVTAIYNSGTPDSLSSYSPVAWWRMEEGSGTSVVNTANSGTNDVTLYNGPTFSTDTP